MSKHRANGEGMIRQWPHGHWEGRLTIGHNNDGTPIFHYFSGHTQKEIVALLRQKQLDFRGVDLCERCKMSVSEWLDEWMANYAAPSIRSTTLNAYKNYMGFVKAELGNRPIYKITSDDVQQLYIHIQENSKAAGHPLAPSTIHGIHGVLHQAMDVAVLERLIPHNPTENVTLPKMEVTKKQILNNEQLDRFFEVIQTNELWTDFFQTEMTTGLRVGEICGLQWVDFDADRGTLTVQRTVHKEAGGILSTGDTKTEKGTRVITLPPSTVELLKNRKQTAIPQVQWIFPDFLKPENPISPTKAYHQLKEFLREADLPDMRFHDLRHTFATHALSSGVDAKTLSGILGHSKPSFTLDTYTQMTSDMQKKAAGIVGDFMSEIMI